MDTPSDFWGNGDEPNAQQNIESAKELLVDRHFYNSFGDIFYDESIKEIMEKIVAEAKALADGVAEKTGNSWHKHKLVMRCSACLIPV